MCTGGVPVGVVNSINDRWCIESHNVYSRCLSILIFTMRENALVICSTICSWESDTQVPSLFLQIEPAISRHSFTIFQHNSLQETFDNISKCLQSMPSTLSKSSKLSCPHCCPGFRRPASLRVFLAHIPAHIVELKDWLAPSA